MFNPNLPSPVTFVLSGRLRYSYGFGHQPYGPFTNTCRGPDTNKGALKIFEGLKRGGVLKKNHAKFYPENRVCLIFNGVDGYFPWGKNCSPKGGPEHFLN